MKLTTVLAIMLLISISTPLLAGEKFFVAKIYDHEKNITYQVVTPEELKQIEQECRNEERYLAKAVAAAEKMWKKNEETAKITFPRSAVSPKKITPGIQINSREDADAKLTKYQDSIAEKAAREEEAAKKNKKKGPATAGDERKIARENAKDKIETEARAMIESQLSQLIEEANLKSSATSAEAPKEAVAAE